MVLESVSLYKGLIVVLPYVQVYQFHLKHVEYLNKGPGLSNDKGGLKPRGSL